MLNSIIPTEMYSCTRLEVILVAGVRVRSWGLFRVQAKLVTGATARRVVSRDPSIQIFASKGLGLKGSWDPGTDNTYMGP